MNLKDITESLPLGSVIKIPHEGCSNSKALRVEHKPDGIYFYCFKCGAFWVDRIQSSVAEKKRRREIYELTKQKQAEFSIELPADFSNRINSHGLAWLGSGGWTVSLIQLYNIGWSESLNRVIIPVRYKGYHGYTARSVEDWQTPKYLEKIRNKHPWVSADLKGDTICLAEDVLSAGRIGQFIPSMALLGIKINEQALSIIQLYKNILIWLDPDKAGYTGTVQIAKKLSLYKKIRIIKSDKDPKCLTNNQIKDKL